MGKVKTRIERNKEIITEVYNFIKDSVIKKDLERHLRVFIIREKFLNERLHFSWSWIDLATLINLISKEIPREEFDEKCRDSAYGSWCFGDVVDFLANLIVDYPHIIEKLYIKEKEA
jgi:hypothetical protein